MLRVDVFLRWCFFVPLSRLMRLEGDLHSFCVVADTDVVEGLVLGLICFFSLCARKVEIQTQKLCYLASRYGVKMAFHCILFPDVIHKINSLLGHTAVQY
jgi:hypothetical protein